MDVRIEPVPGQRGLKVIIVDDVQWGHIEMHSHGPHGNSFTFSQIGDEGEITEPYDPPSPSGRQRTVRVDGDKSARRRAGRLEIVAPLEERLMAATLDLIKRAKLRHPDVVKKENEEARAAWNAEREAQAAAEEKTFHARASACITPDILDLLRHDNKLRIVLITNIVQAMRWAQTQ